MYDQLLPQPASVEPADGVFVLDETTTIGHDATTAPVLTRFAAALRAATGLPLSIADNATIRCHTGEITDPEGYRITVGPTGIDITVADLGGAEYATQTLRQLLGPDAFRRSNIHSGGWTVPCGTVVDHPRLSWRGCLLDVARHFLPEGGRAAVRRPARRAQAQRAASAPHRRPGLADRGAEIPEADRDQQLAARVGDRRARGEATRPPPAWRLLHHRRPARDRRLRGRPGHHGRARGGRARPCAGRARRLPRTRQHRCAARCVDVLGRQRERAQRGRGDRGLLPRRVRPRAGHLRLADHRRRRRRGAGRAVGAESGRPRPRGGTRLRRRRARAARLVHPGDRQAPGEPGQASAGLGRDRRGRSAAGGLHHRVLAR